MGELSTCCGVNKNGIPFVQVLSNKSTVVQLTPEQAVAFGLGLISAAAEAQTDAAAFLFITQSGRSPIDATSFVASLRSTREKYLEGPAPVADTSPAPAPAPAAVADAPRAECSQHDLCLDMRVRLVEDLDADVERIRVSEYSALRAEVVNIGDEFILVDPKHAHVADGRNWLSVKQRGHFGTTKAKHSRGAEVVCYKFPPEK